MSTILSPTNATGAEVDATAKAVRVVQRPLISSTLGEYACSLRGTNVAASAAGSVWWSFRYSGANLCVVDKVVLDGAAVSIALTAAQAVGWGLSIARAFTVNETTGGSLATLTGNNCKMRTSYSTTGVASIAISNGANLTGGTKTLDVQSMGAVLGGVGAIGTSVPEGSLFDAYSTGHPIVLATNEGMEMINLIAFPAAGVVNFGVTVHWAEVTSAEWA